MNRDQITGVLMLLLAAVTIALSLRLDRPSNAMGAGPELFPLLLGFVLAGLAVVLLVNATLKGAPNWRNVLPAGEGRRNVLVLGGGMIAYGLLLEPVGYLLTSFLVIPAILYGLDRQRRLLFTIGIPVVATVFCYVLLAAMLRVPLPKGIFGLLGIDFF